MSTKHKLLIAIIAVIAFFIGAALNSARVSDQVDMQTLLQAQLSAPIIDNTQAEATPESIEKLLGKKLTLVNFWASWCAPCREEMPVFEALYQRAKEHGFEVIGIAIDSQDKAQTMLDSMGITYPVLYAQNTGMTLMDSAGNSQGLLPYSLLLDQNGEMIHQVLGIVHESDIINWLSEAGIDISSTL